MSQRAVFLDRDGTIIEEMGHATRPEQIRILAGVARALIRLADAGYKLIVVTNQSAIARGMMNEDDLNRFHQALDEQLDLLGARVDAYYTCPHLADASKTQRPDLTVDCDCRKPKPGLLIQAADDMDLDLAASWIVGDMWRDIQAGQAADVRTIKLPTVASQAGPRPPEVAPPTAEVSGIEEAAEFILRHPEPEPAAESQHAGTPVAPPPSPEEPEVHEAPAEESEAPAEEPEAAAEEHEAPAEEPGPPAEAAPVALAEPVAKTEPATKAEPPSAPAERETSRTVEEPEVESRRAGTAAMSARPIEQPAPPPSPPPARPRPAAPPDTTCARCGVKLSDAEFIAAGATRRDGLLLCEECVVHLPSDETDRLPDTTADLLRSILMELRRIARSRRPHSLSFLRMMAYLILAGAIFCALVLGFVSADKTHFVLVGIFLQLVALTLLVVERNS